MQVMARDLMVKCAECGTMFAWTAGEQIAGPQPALCPACRLLVPASGRQRGLVKWYSRAKGYGFITPVVGPELFVHKSGLAEEQAPLRAGQLVEFELVTTDRGAQAANVVVLGAEGGGGADENGPLPRTAGAG